MRITPTGNVPPAPSPVPTQTGVRPDVKARVVAMLQGQPEALIAENHSVNPNNISPEEMSAIQPQTQETQEVVQETVQEPAKEEKPQIDPRVSKQFAQLARQEKALRAKVQQQEQAFKAEMPRTAPIAMWKRPAPCNVKGFH